MSILWLAETVDFVIESRRRLRGTEMDVLKQIPLLRNFDKVFQKIQPISVRTFGNLLMTLEPLRAVGSVDVVVYNKCSNP